MPSSQVRPLPQGPPSFVKGSRASGSANEVLVIALATLTYGKICGGEDEHGRSLENAMVAVETASHRLRRGQRLDPAAGVAMWGPVDRRVPQGDLQGFGERGR